MKKEAICIMLVDDNKHDNFFHEREIKKANFETIVITKESGDEALEYLNSMIDSDSNSQSLFFWILICQEWMDGSFLINTIS